MKLKTAKDILSVAKARGFKVEVRPGPPPMPVLFNPTGPDTSHATPVLLQALKAFRLEIIEELTKAKIESNGHT